MHSCLLNNKMIKIIIINQKPMKLKIIICKIGKRHLQVYIKIHIRLEIKYQMIRILLYKL
jgi:hypothetical protein